MDKNALSNDEVLFNINQVAKIIDVVPATIRNWEKQGLFIAKRKSNNYRVYNLDDIEMLKKIKQFSTEDHMGMSAIKTFLRTTMIGLNNTGPSVYSQEAKYSKKLLSNKWKEAREKLNYTLEEVSNHVAVSSSYLSKIENGQANISFDILNKLANFYGESILYFFDQDITESKVVKKDTGERIDVGIPGVNMESLVSVKNHILYPMIFNVEPGCGSLESHSHHGEEFIHILSGKIEVILNTKEIYILKEGDSIYFKSFEHHGWRNIGKKTARLLWVHSPIEG